MNIRLDLYRRCIETALRRLNEQSVTACFKAPQQERDRHEKLVTITKGLLETVDFGRLRSLHPSLAGGSHDRVILSVSRNHVALWVEDILIETFHLVR